jgi:glycosyltransferase involved in cell wall biosynthesis
MKAILVRSTAMDTPVHKMAKSLSQNGYNVHILEWDRLKIYKKDEVFDGLYSSHRFQLCAPQGKIELIFFLPLWWLYESYFLLREEADVIHSCDFDTLIPAILAKLIKRVKLFYTIYDFYSEFAGSIHPLLGKIISFTEKQALRFVDVLFMVNEAMIEELKGTRVKKVIIIYNTPIDYTIKKEQFSTKYAPSYLKIFYAGWLTKPRGLKHMVDSIRDISDVKLVVAGDGPYKDAIDKDLMKQGKIEYLGWIPHDEVIRRELEADVLFFFYDPSLLNGKYSSPNKLFEAMMCSKPIIANDGLFMSKIISKEKCGIIVPYGDTEAIKISIKELKENVCLRTTLGQNGRKAYEERYNWKIMELRLIDAYASLHS